MAIADQFEMLPPDKIRTSKFCAPVRHYSDQPDIPFGRLDHVVQAACKYLLSETQCVILCRVERDVRRQRKRVGINDGIHDNRSLLVGQSFRESLFHVARILETDAFRAHRFGHAREIRILEIHSKGNEAGFLLLNFHEIE